MKTSKERAIDLILYGIAIKYIPLLFVGMIVNPEGEHDQDLLSPFFALMVLGLFIVGYVFFIRGCLAYAKSKGYAKNWGWLGLLSVIGLAPLLMIPAKGTQGDLEVISSISSEEKPFFRINLPEILLLFFLSIPILLYALIWLFCLFNQLDFEELLYNNILLSVIGIVLFCYYAFVLWKITQKAGFNLSQFLGLQKKINISQIILIAFSNLAFASSFNRITLYSLSFIFPNLVKEQINYKSFTNLSEWILMFIVTIFLAPIVEEFLYRGLMLQKWGVRWGVRWGVILSSLVFVIYHFRFDVISLFIGGVFFSILYIRTSNLFAPILCHGLYNSIVFAWSTVVFLSQSVTEREAIISISEYQNSVAPLLSQYVLLTILSSLCLLYLFYKNLPRGIQKIPYLKNQELKYD